MDYDAFYRKLFGSVEERLGALDEDTLMGLVGFDEGGPLNLCTVGHGKGRLVTYVSCELAVREEQVPSSIGRFELMVTCDDEDWARSVLSTLGRMSLEVQFAPGHTVDIGAWVDEKCSSQGLVLEEFGQTSIDGTRVGILRVVGITRQELEQAILMGADGVLEWLPKREHYPNTLTR